MKSTNTFCTHDVNVILNLTSHQAMNLNESNEPVKLQFNFFFLLLTVNNLTKEFSRHKYCFVYCSITSQCYLGFRLNKPSDGICLPNISTFRTAILSSFALLNNSFVVVFNFIRYFPQLKKNYEKFYNLRNRSSSSLMTNHILILLYLKSQRRT